MSGFISYDFFMAALEYWESKTHSQNLSARQILEDKTGFTQGYISKLLNKKRAAPISYKAQVKLAAACGYSYFDFLELGKKLLAEGHDAVPAYAALAHPPPDTSTPDKWPAENVRQIDRDHSQVIRRFTDKTTACEINSQLVAIEQADPKLFERIAGYIEAHYHAVCRPGAAGKRGKAARGEGKTEKAR